MDLNLTDAIIAKTQRNTGLFSKKTVLEVGPGPGSLTRSIIHHGCQKLVVVEKDRRFLPALTQIKESVEERRIDIVLTDILKVDERSLFDSLDAPVRGWDEEADCVIVGNLPFSVSTPLLMKWIRQLHWRKGVFAYGRVPLSLMFQRELADRLISSPGTREYGRLAVMVQIFCHVKIITHIGRRNFVPAPDVDASMVYFEPRLKPVGEVDLQALDELTRLAFNQKRKVIGNSIKYIHENAGVLLKIAGINPQLRGEQIPLEKWCLLSTVYRRSIFYRQDKINAYDKDGNDASKLLTLEDLENMGEM
eukprot:TRINITY_DN7642_c0_g1_i1.p1 TRINITY_DN7642_c0_g1~~TRINITY_DN7642_c0_g1_i1.p1  ORF type:complete len:351 (-),score=52.70 TRINITY_DN7642_c0_g1_i1:166-1083(-)